MFPITSYTLYNRACIEFKLTSIARRTLLIFTETNFDAVVICSNAFETLKRTSLMVGLLAGERGRNGVYANPC